MLSVVFPTIDRLCVSTPDRLCVPNYMTCNMCYIGETGRTFGTRLEEHKKDVETVISRRFTREARKCWTNVKDKSVITDHADRHNCVIDWEGAKVVDKETNTYARWIKEAIGITKMEPTMNRNEGATA